MVGYSEFPFGTTLFPADRTISYFHCWSELKGFEKQGHAWQPYIVQVVWFSVFDNVISLDICEFKIFINWIFQKQILLHICQMYPEFDKWIHELLDQIVRDLKSNVEDTVNTASTSSHSKRVSAIVLDRRYAENKLRIKCMELLILRTFTIKFIKKHDANMGNGKQKT